MVILCNVCLWWRGNRNSTCVKVAFQGGVMLPSFLRQININLSDGDLGWEKKKKESSPTNVASDFFSIQTTHLKAAEPCVT